MATAPAAGAFKVNEALFFSRAKALTEHWVAHRDEHWSGVNSFVVTAGKDEDEASVYWQSIATHLFLFDAELSETIMVFTPEKVFLCGSNSKVKKLRVLEAYAKEHKCVPAIQFVVKGKKDNAEQYEELLAAVTAAGAKCGSFLKEVAVGAFAEGWTEALKGALGEGLVDVTEGFQEALGAKDNQELKSCKVAAVLSAAVMKRCVEPKLENIVDKDNAKYKHQKIADEIEAIFDDPRKALEKKWPAIKKVNTDRVESTYPAIVQSGGSYNLKANAQTDENNLHFGTEDSPGVIIVSLGARYKGYCANISRTYMVNPTEAQKKNYALLLELREHLFSLVTAGRRIGDLLLEARKFVEAKDPELAPKLTKNVGSGIGLLFRERHFLLNTKNDAKMRANMVFNLAFGFGDLDNDTEREGGAKDERGAKYAMMLADTVICKGDRAGSCEVLTKGCGCALKDACWELGGDEDEEEDQKKDNLEGLFKGVQGGAGQKTRNALTESATDERQSRQQTLAARDRKEALKRFNKQKTGKKEKKASVMVAYESVARYPPTAAKRTDQIYVDNASDSIFLPICGTMVPFHVTFIKNVSRNIDPGGKFVELRINFWTPAAPVSAADRPVFKDLNAQFLKEVTLKSAQLTKINANFQMINSMRKEYRNREKERQDKESLVTMQSLKLFTGGAPPRLTDVQIKPTVGGRGRRSGTLELHKNGLRYKSSQNAPLDITYQNIKYAFYQAAVNDMKSEFRDDHCRIHFHLRHDIMIGKKKVNSIQFCTQIGEEQIKLHEVRRSAYDPDEYEEEQRERQRRARINKMFKTFAMRVQAESRKTEYEVEFDIPYKDLVFTGRAEMKGSHKGEASFMPTKDCLVDLSETPFFVLDVSLVEIVYFERVTHGTKNFDVVFIFKDYETFQRIDAIPSRKLEALKTWVDTCNLRYYEGVAALKWKDVLGHARKDPEDFWEQGGWESYLGETGPSDEEGSDGSEDDESFDEESEEESEEYESEGEGESEEDESDEYGGEAELSEEGETWEEAEERAKREDKDESRKRNMMPEQDERPRSKKKSRR